MKKDVCGTCGEPRSNSESDPHGMFGYHPFTPREEPKTTPVLDVNDRLRDAALRAFVWQTIATRATQMKDEARAELTGIPVGETVAAKWGDQLLAKAGMSKGKAKLVVTDEQALLDWVAEKHPDEIIRAVNPAYVKAIEAKAKSLGLGAVIDNAGDVIPGVEIQVGDPSVSVRKEASVDALQVVAELLSGGHFRLDSIKELEPGV